MVAVAGERLDVVVQVGSKLIGCSFLLEDCCVYLGDRDEDIKSGYIDFSLRCAGGPAAAEAGRGGL